jgi:hypothetical protein
MKTLYKLLGFLVIQLMFVYGLQSQVIKDSIPESPVSKEKKGSIFAGRPGKSMLMSLVIPGAGQIYNKSYIRLPFVYGAVGGTGWIMVDYVKKYNCLKEAYVASIDGTPFVPTDNSSFCKQVQGITDPNTLRILRDEYNVYRQRSILIFALVWVAQGIDAYVDAHLKEFNISDELSFAFTAKSFDDPVAPMRYGLFVNF